MRRPRPGSQRARHLAPVLWGLIGCWLSAAIAFAQTRPYIGFAFPAGGQQGTTVSVRLGGQDMDEAEAVLVSGGGVTGRIVEVLRRLNNLEIQLLNEQLRALKGTNQAEPAMMTSTMATDATMMSPPPPGGPSAVRASKDAETATIIEKLEHRTREWVQNPACAAISTLVVVELTIASEATPGERELRVQTRRGLSNPLFFHVGQLPEFTRKPMLTASRQVLGKEAQALRKRPKDEMEVHISMPCTLNGQIASGEVNRYRFEARQGQRLVFSVLARQLIPFIADAVPGWFQPVLELYDAEGRQVAAADDFRFQPDPTLFYEVPKNGPYVLAIHDSLYRGREDFVYRLSVGELPFVTDIFPLGGKLGEAISVQLNGWHLTRTQALVRAANSLPGMESLPPETDTISCRRIPFAWDNLPECFATQSGSNPGQAQPVQLPIVMNGRINHPDDWDVFSFAGRSNEVVVAEVLARRLDSPLDSVIRLTDAEGTVLAVNDDHEDLCAGINTHQADSYVMVRLPADGTYQIHLGDTARHGGRDYAYRLRLSAPRPDFALRVVPSSLSLRSKNSANLTVFVSRQDGFRGPIKVALKNPPAGFTCVPVTLQSTQTMVKLPIKTDLVATETPVELAIVGKATQSGAEIERPAIPAEDRMQAFLWRQLVPARDLKVMVFNPSAAPPPTKRLARTLPAIPKPGPANQSEKPDKPASETNANPSSASPTSGKPAFTAQQIKARLRQLDLLYEEGLLTDEFYVAKVAECEAAR